MRPTSTKRLRFFVALVCAGTLLVAACSNSGDDESSNLLALRGVFLQQRVEVEHLHRRSQTVIGVDPLSRCRAAIPTISRRGEVDASEK